MLGFTRFGAALLVCLLSGPALGVGIPHPVSFKERQSLDCASETGGETGEKCQDLATDALFVCETGPCNETNAWVAYSGGAGGGGAPTGALYWVGAAHAELDAEIVVTDEATLEAAVGSINLLVSTELDSLADLEALLGVGLATQPELDAHEANASAHHVPTVDTGPVPDCGAGESQLGDASCYDPATQPELDASGLDLGDTATPNVAAIVAKSCAGFNSSKCFNTIQAGIDYIETNHCDGDRSILLVYPGAYASGNTLGTTCGAQTNILLVGAVPLAKSPAVATDTDFQDAPGAAYIGFTDSDGAGDEIGFDYDSPGVKFGMAHFGCHGYKKFGGTGDDEICIVLDTNNSRLHVTHAFASSEFVGASRFLVINQTSGVGIGVIVDVTNSIFTNRLDGWTGTVDRGWFDIQDTGTSGASVVIAKNLFLVEGQDFSSNPGYIFRFGKAGTAGSGGFRPVSISGNEFWIHHDSQDFDVLRFFADSGAFDVDFSGNSFFGEDHLGDPAGQNFRFVQTVGTGTAAHAVNVEGNVGLHFASLASVYDTEQIHTGDIDMVDEIEVEVPFCGNPVDGTPHYLAPDTRNGERVNFTNCDDGGVTTTAIDSATEATANKLLFQTEHRPESLKCVLATATATDDVLCTLRDDAADVVGMECTISQGDKSCTITSSRITYAAAGSEWAVEADAQGSENVSAMVAWVVFATAN